MIVPTGFEAFWNLYRRSEIRLPRPPSPRVPPRRVEGLVPLLESGRYDAVVLDAWGVLNLGDDAPIPAAHQAFAALRHSGLPLRVLSNDAGADPPQAAAGHARRGFAVRPDEIVFGLDLLGETLARRGLTSARCALVAPRPAPRADLTRAMVDLFEPAADAADAVVLLSTVGFTAATYDRLRELLARRGASATLIVGNPDIASPDPHGMAAEPGCPAHQLADALGFEPVFLGKPFPAVYDRLRATLPGVAPDRILCVGDTLHTDILGGAAAGMDTLLVASGFLRGQPLEARCAEAGISPTWIAAHL